MRACYKGYWLRGVDLKYPEFSPIEADDFIIADLRDSYICRQAVDQRFDEVFQLAGDMGGQALSLQGRMMLTICTILLSSI